MKFLTLELGKLVAKALSALAVSFDPDNSPLSDTDVQSAIDTLANKIYWYGVGDQSQIVGNSVTPVDLVTRLDSTSGAGFTFDPLTNELTFNKSGVYKIEYSGSADTADGGRRQARFDLFLNGTAIPNTAGFTYNRNNAAGENTASNRALLSITSGDRISLRVVRSNNAGAGSTQIITVTAGISLLVEEK